MKKFLLILILITCFLNLRAQKSKVNTKTTDPIPLETVKETYKLAMKCTNRSSGM